ncbi:MAG: acyl-CoA/acyl-ACP dehydrogenase [Actinobacteria bacterium]|nr:acyl-CoA/acyl-ACP dehydrogenase [Actinomycetota bacterium]
MDFTFSAEQDQLRDAVRSFLESKAPSAYVRSMMEDDRGITDEVWDQLVELGWTEITDLVDLTVVLEEMGKLPFPGPYLSAAVLAPMAARRLGAEEVLGSGGLGTIALEEQGSGDPVTRVRTRATKKAGKWLLTGEKPVVLDGHLADWVLVAALTDEGLGTFVIEKPAGELVSTWDQTRKVARVVLDGRVAQPVGPAGDHTAAWRRVADDGAVALCSELIGTTEKALDLAVEYAKVRVQFGRPIASFQAIKHKAADMLHKLTLARVGTHYAAWASYVDDPVREEAVAMAKSYSGEAAVFVTGESIQIHGGVGFTWDCDAHLHYRRAKQSDLMLGYQGWQRERLADLVLS